MSALPEDLDAVDPERKAGALIDRIAADSRKYHRTRPRSFTAREALSCLEFEALFVAIAAANLAQGIALSSDDRERLWLSSSRVTTICEEALTCR